MTPRQIQKVIHDLGFTTNTARAPHAGYYTILVDLNEKEARSSKFCIDTIDKISFAMQIYTTDKLSVESQWVGNLFIKQIKANNQIFATFILNSETQVLTLTIY